MSDICEYPFCLVFVGFCFDSWRLEVLFYFLNRLNLLLVALGISEVPEAFFVCTFIDEITI